MVEIISWYKVDLLIRLFREVKLSYERCLLLYILHEALLLLLLLLGIALHEYVVSLSDVSWHYRLRTRR